MLKSYLLIATPFVALIGAPVAAIAYDMSEQTTHYKTGTEFLSGQPAVWSYEVGKLGIVGGEKLVGYYGGGNPRVIGLGCDGAKMPIIAMEEDLLPRCDAVEPIANHREYLEQR